MSIIDDPLRDNEEVVFDPDEPPSKFYQAFLDSVNPPPPDNLGRPLLYRREGQLKIITGRMTPDQIACFKELGGFKWLRRLLDVYRGVRTPNVPPKKRNIHAANEFLKETLVPKNPQPENQ